MKKFVQKILSMAVTAALLTGMSGITSLAAEAPDGTITEEAGEVEVLEAEVIKDAKWPSEIVPYTTLVQCYIGVVSDSEGMHIGISTGTAGKASALGVKDVKIQKKNWLGLWTTVATSEGGEVSDCASMCVNILYRNAEKDATYRILCIHYGDVDGYHELDHDSGSFVHTY